MAAAKKTRTAKGKREELAGQTDPRAPLDSTALLAAAKPVLQRLEDELHARALASPAVTAALTTRYEAEKAAQRTAESFAGWTAALSTQVAAAWLLSCVFVRTLEDRGLLKQNRLAGPGAEDSQKQFFQLAPSLTERDYLLTVFRELARHPAAAALFDAHHSLVWKLSPSAEVAKELLALFRAPTASAPVFRFGQASTRFLGDMYQDLSEDVRKRYALLQTPDFVEAYILDYTLEPAVKRFGLDDTTLIDPTCGSGHFLLGAFDRLFEHRLRAEPGIDARVAATKALDCVYGADINPYAVAVARFRLTLAFMDKAGYSKFADAPALPLHLVCADSLRTNPQHPQQELWQHAGAGEAGEWLGNVFAFDDERAAKDVLNRQYAAVVGNPPYITVKDAALREVYRGMYASCHRSYSLSVPFCERIFQLARPRGYTGQITANSFIKREFGKRLIEQFLPTVNLERIVNTSGAYIPGHGTPTVLLFGTNESRQGTDVLAMLAKRGEPSTPSDPSQGLVWRSVVDHGHEVGFENEYLSVSRIARDTLQRHPWSLGGGGKAELKELLEERATTNLKGLGVDVGTGAVTREDDVYLVGDGVLSRWRIPAAYRREAVVGENVRDWAFMGTDAALWPYDLPSLEPRADEAVQAALWPWRTQLRIRVAFGKTQIERGLPWTAYSMFFATRARTPLTITFAFVATHNHFALKRGVTVFNRSAPIIKLPESANEDDYLALLAYLNSSTACFWMKQVFHNKGGGTDSGGWQSEEAKGRFEFSVTGMEALPVPRLDEVQTELCASARLLIALAAERDAVVEDATQRLLSGARIESAVADDQQILEKMITVQEEIDWIVYERFGLDTPTPGNHIDLSAGAKTPLGSRPFELMLASRGETRSIDGHLLARDITSVDNESLGEIIQRREARIRSSPELGIIEDAQYKRRWAITPKDFAGRILRFEDRVREALTSAIQIRLEAAARPYPDCWSWKSVAEAAAVPVDALRWLMERAATTLDLKSMIDSQAVPFLASLRYSEQGIHRYNEWEALWEAQRAEDLGRPLTLSAPPKYREEDYVSKTIADLRGKLDVPKERFISYPYCESDQDGEPVYGWAGWDHLQRSQALASLYLKRKDGEGWTKERLTPMLAGLLELIPWVKQWHNEPSAEFGGLRMGDYFEQFLDGECRQHGLTHDDLRVWRPPGKTRGAAKKPKSKKDAASSESAEQSNGESDVVSPKPKKSRSKKKPATSDAEAATKEAE